MMQEFLFPSAALNDRIEIGQEGGEEDWLGARTSPQENQYAHCSLQLTYQHMPATSAWRLKQSAATTGTLASPAFYRSMHPGRCLVQRSSPKIIYMCSATYI